MTLRSTLHSGVGGRQELAFRPGPVFTNVLLADEINRTPPKTQAALLEAMQERAGQRRRRLPPAARAVPRRGHAEPHRVRGHLPAARGPARPLPAQGRRRLPDGRRRGGHAPPRPPGRRRRSRSTTCRWRASAADLAAARAEVDATTVADEVIAYVAAVVRRTRELPSVALGASPRAAVHLLAAARAAARLPGPGLRHPRRRRRHGPARAAPPPAAAARGRARALPARRRRGRRPRRRPRAPVSPIEPDARALAGSSSPRLALALPLPAAGARRRSSSSRSLAAAAVDAWPSAAARDLSGRCPAILARGVPGRAGRRRRRRRGGDPGAPARPARPRPRPRGGGRAARRHASSPGGGAATPPGAGGAGRRAGSGSARVHHGGGQAGEVARVPRPAGGPPAGAWPCARAASGTPASSPGARSGSAPTSSRSATTCPTTTSARSTGGPPPAPAGR